MPSNKHAKAPSLPLLEPIGISPKRAADLVDVSLATMSEWIRLGLVASTLVRGRRIVDYQSLKRRAAPDKVRQIRKGIHNPANAQAEAETPRS